MKAFSPDSLHINKKNFGALFSFIHENKWSYEQHTQVNHLINRYGNYKDCPLEIYDDYNVLKKYDKDLLWKVEIKGINVFQLIKLELLSYLAKSPNLSKLGMNFDSYSVFEYAYVNDHDILIKNLAAGCFYIRYWSDFLQDKKYDFVFIFSGCLIYSRSLMELLKITSTRVFILESFFTGNEFYFEERFSPLPNDSLLANSNYYNAIKIHKNSYIKDRTKAINKYLLSNNLNVNQPEFDTNLPYEKGKYVLILGQVVNDFSLLNSKNLSLSSLAIYECLIKKLVEKTEHNIIFKAHPWENNKTNLNAPVTANYLETIFSELLGGRLTVVENFNLPALIEGALCVVTINSQSAIEAAYHGVKPIILGDAFYGNKGFTHDIGGVDVECCVNLIKKGRFADFTLTLPEYDFFEKFLVKALLYSLICKSKSGSIQLNQLLSPLNNSIPLITPQNKQLSKQYYKSETIELVELRKLLRQAKSFLAESYTDDALHLIMEAEKLYPNNINIKRQKAEIFLKKGNRKKCIQLLRQARKVLPKNKNLKRRYLVVKYRIFKIFYGNHPFEL